MNWSILLICLEFRNPHKVVNRLTVYFAEDGMFFIQPRTLVNSHEELRLVHVDLSRVCHGDDSSSTKLKSRVKLIEKWFSVNAAAALTRTSRVSSLDHEAFNYSVENCFIVVAFHAKLNKVATRPRCFFSP